jgi:cell wall-associated NlpC family hydrolase
MEIPRASRLIWASKAKTVSLKNAQPGDIIIFSANKGGKGAINHSAILLDKNSMIHSVSDGPQRGIIISPLDDKYFGPRIIGIKSFF